jgi:hypothetical protein
MSSTHIRQLIIEALLNPKHFTALKAFPPNQIAEALDEEDLELTEAQMALVDQDPAGLEQFYAFLAEATPMTPTQRDALQAAFEVVEASEESIGQSFKNGLCRDLPSQLLDPTDFFRKHRAAVLDDDVVASLSDRSDVVAAGDAILPFLPFGITPVSIYHACDAPRTLAMRKGWNDTVVVPLADGKPSSRPRILTFDDIADEAASLDDNAPAPHRAILDWLISIVEEEQATRKFIFRGFTALLEGKELRLAPHGGDSIMQEIDIELQWSPYRWPEVEDKLPSRDWYDGLIPVMG